MGKQITQPKSSHTCEKVSWSWPARRVTDRPNTNKCYKNHKPSREFCLQKSQHLPCSNPSWLYLLHKNPQLATILGLQTNDSKAKTGAVRFVQLYAVDVPTVRCCFHSLLELGTVRWLCDHLRGRVLQPKHMSWLHANCASVHYQTSLTKSYLYSGIRHLKMSHLNTVTLPVLSSY